MIQLNVFYYFSTTYIKMYLQSVQPDIGKVSDMCKPDAGTKSDIFEPLPKVCLTSYKNSWKRNYYND